MNPVQPFQQEVAESIKNLREDDPVQALSRIRDRVIAPGSDRKSTAD